MAEIIWDKEKGFDFTETIKPEIIETPNYDYWQSQNTLDYNIAIRNKPDATWSKVFCWWNSRLSYSWTWTQAITWVWFKPKLITIQAVFASWEWSFSDWQWMSTTDNFCIYQQNQSWWSYTLMTYDFRIIFVRNYTWTLTSRASISSIDDDWFTLNWVKVWLDVYFKYQCFG